MKSRKNMNRRSFITTATVAGGTIAGVAGVAAYNGNSATSSAVANLQETDPETGTPEATPTTQRETVPPELAQAADTDWPVECLDLAQQRAVAGSSISSDTVDTLAEAWTLPIPAGGAYGALTANPIISGDMLYLQDAKSNVYAVNRESGEEQWTKQYDQDIPSGGPNGIAIGYGSIVYPVGNSQVVRVDAATGEDVWTVDIEGPRGEGITMAPLIFDNRVYISTIPGSVEDFYQGGMRGVIKVLDFGSGDALWYFDTTTDNLWGNPAVNSGGGLWHPPAIDEDGYIYAAIANAAPYPGTEEWPSGSSRPGPNEYCNHLLKINPETGGLDWALPITGRDLFDLDNHLGPVLATVDVNGTPTEMVFTSGKHGYVVAADPSSGGELWRTPVGTHQNDELQEIPEGETVEVWPGTYGGVETSIAYRDGVIYVPVFENPTSYTPTGIAGGGADFSQATGMFYALNAADGTVLWEIELPSGPLAAATVVNDLVFTGTLDGLVRAYNITDGTLVWSAQTTAGLNAPLAISGDYLYVPAGGPLLPSEDTEEPAPETSFQLIAYKLGSGGAASPAAATPSGD